ncbi:MAG TPA: hypothetical protein V6D17_16355 [Candidatus Obscuribacterales bacterium]
MNAGKPTEKVEILSAGASLAHFVSIRLSFLFVVLALAFAIVLPAQAGAPPVRISIIPGGSSGIEQEACDRIAHALESSSDIVFSTVNPDWFVVCTITDKNDQASGQIRYNGTVVVKTNDGQVVDTFSVQKYSQDFSFQPGTPLNKRLVDQAARDVIQAMSDRAVNPIQKAVAIEMETRERIIRAETLAQDDKYEEAMAILREVGPDSPRFRSVRDLMDEYALEIQAIQLVDRAKQRARQGNFASAVQILKQVSKKSKRYKLAQHLMAKYTAGRGA